MTIQQLQYVLEISKTGSVSKAAKNLYMSQPNISNAIKNLENELGVTIFERTPMGMCLTPAGQRLRQKAAAIMEDIKEITMDSSTQEDVSFRLVYPRYIPAFNAFCNLCRQYQSRPSLHFSCYIGDGERQVESIYQNMCDLVVYRGADSPSLHRLCSDLRVRYVPIKKAHFYIQLSEEHPLLKESVFDIKKLKEYPYVAFADLNDWNANWTPWEDIINPNRLICVQSTSSRVSLVSHTQAYSIVLPHSEEYNKANHVVRVPFESHEQSIGYLYSLDRGLSDLAKEYLELFEEELLH